MRKYCKASGSPGSMYCAKSLVSLFGPPLSACREVVAFVALCTVQISGTVSGSYACRMCDLRMDVGCRRELHDITPNTQRDTSIADGKIIIMTTSVVRHKLFTKTTRS